MKFELPALTKGKCTHVNFRPENHGDEPQMAVDINVNFNLPNTALDMFDPDLRRALYFSQAGDNGQTDIDGVDKVLPNFRFPSLKVPFGWEAALTGFTLEIDYGLGDEGDSNLRLEMCKVGKFKLTPAEGGTVNIACQIQNNTDQLDTDMCGKLSGLALAPYIELRLIAPEVVPENAGGPDEDDVDPDAPDGDTGWPFPGSRPPADPPLSAGDIFANAVDGAPSNVVPVTIKKGRKGKGLGTDADQAARQEKVLAEHDAAGSAH